jgi:outer membrane lipopolysaccharide assembly protein LptE/RlpB
MRRRAFLLFPGAASLAGCGYHVGGKADLLPADIRTIAIPAFANNTNRYKLTEKLPGAITHEFLTRTRYRIVAKPEEADAVLSGTVLNVISAPTIFDSTSGRAAGIQISVILSLTLKDRAGKVLFTRPALETRNRYEVSIEESAYFDESANALDRLSQEVARNVVSSVLEAF